MPVDYSRWRSVEDEEDEKSEPEASDAEEPEDATKTASTKKPWSRMSPAERLAAEAKAKEEEQKLADLRQKAEDKQKEAAKSAASADYAWLHDVDPDSYEDFTVKRVLRVVKPRGVEFFKDGKYKEAEEQWLGGLALVRRIGFGTTGAKQLYIQLKCNLAKLYVVMERRHEARQVCTAVLDMDPKSEKALWRRAEANLQDSNFLAAQQDLETLLQHNSSNNAARQKLQELRAAKRNERQTSVCSAHPPSISAAPAGQELTADGSLRKLQILKAGQTHPEDVRWTWPWGLDEWLGQSSKKAVLTVHVVVRSVGGEELFTTRARARLPKTPLERDELRAAMQEVAALDDLAGKQPRRLDDFLSTEEAMPLRWRYGDPSVYVGFELAARSMMLGEQAVFEIDQPLLEPSVREFYKARGGVARVAGLPEFRHHIEPRKLSLLAEELPEWELDLENKVHRTVRAELELVALDLYRDISPNLTGDFLVNVRSLGHEDGLLLAPGDMVLGGFTVAGALDGSCIYQVSEVEWRLGKDDSGRKCRTRYGDDVFVPRCIGKILRAVAGEGLREQAIITARLQEGPTPFELNPALASQYSWERSMQHRPPVAITVEVREVLRNQQ